MESSIICGVRRQGFEELVERNPTLGTRVTRLLGERLIQTEGRLAGVVRKERCRSASRARSCVLWRARGW